ncbi:hypothetical protein RB595_001786 [Gaeumannomyces hyphopodioides]
MGDRASLSPASTPGPDGVRPLTGSTSPVHFHLVHGAWHGPFTFDLLRAELECRGYPTSVSALPSVGTSDPDVGLYADGAAVRADLEGLVDAGKEVVLVAHSYGGLATSNGVEGLGVQQRKADGKNGGVLSHVFLTAMALDPGRSLDSMQPGGDVPEWLRITPDGRFRSVVPEKAKDIFVSGVLHSTCPFGVHIPNSPVRTTRPCVQWVTATAFEEPSRYAPWKNGFNVGYIFTTEDVAVPFSFQQAMFSQFPAGSFTATMETGHSPFFNEPKELADNLVAAYKHAKTL